MKRIGVIILLTIFALFSAYGQSGGAGSIDVILLLDTSTAMSSSYDNVNNYITGNFLTEFVRVGDTFHLIAFSGSPRLDVARRIAATGDIETIIGRMMLQYPIERGSNIQAALTYAEQYSAALPSRPKKIVLVSTGTNDTPNLVQAANQRLSSRNTTIDFVRVTPGQAITNTPKSGRPGSGGIGSGIQGSGIQGSGVRDQGSGVGTSGTVGGTTGTTGTTQGTGNRDQGSGIGTQETMSNEQRAMSNDLTTDTTVEGREIADGQRSDTDYEASGGDSWSSTHTTDTLKDSGSGINFSSSLPWIIGLILLLLLIIGLIMLLSSRKLSSSPNRVMAQVASSSGPGGKMDRVDHSKDLARYASSQSRRTTPYADRQSPGAQAQVINPHGPLLLNLFVEDQNTAIGKRNIHSLKSGYSLSVGGGKGDGFLIFLVPLPANLGELKRNGSSLSFIPKKAKYFPDIGSNEVRDCLGKTIRVISDKNYELRFRFEMYEDPLIALNRMLNSIKVPG